MLLVLCVRFWVFACAPQDVENKEGTRSWGFAGVNTIGGILRYMQLE